MVRQRFGYALTLAGALAFVIPAFAQKPANAPANATAQCTDGTYSTAKTEKAACSKHGGVKTFWGAGDEKTSTSATSTKSTAGAGGSAAAAGGGAASIPKGSTGQCTDGTYTRAKTQATACSKHGGVKTWFAAASAAAPASTPAPTPKTGAPAASAATGSQAASTPESKTTAKSTSKAATVARPTDAPPTATAKCKDGTYSTSKTHSGACSHHGGVAEWYK